MTKAYILSTAKNGHVTQCIEVAKLLGIKVEEVIQVRGINKAQSVPRREIGKLAWLPEALRMAWKFRKGRAIILSSGRSVLLACWLLKLLRGDNLFVLFIGSPKKWKRRCTDVILRAKHEREAGVDENNRYPWQPEQVWTDAPICQPLPGAGSPGTEVAVLLGGLNITYGDDVAAYEDFLTDIERLSRTETVTIVFSRRTKAPVRQAVHQRFAGKDVKLVEADDRAGFLKACADAGAFVVTPDSITMVAEACATGKPVYVGQLPVKRNDTRNYRFISSALENGHIEKFTGKVDFEHRVIDLSYIDRARDEMAGYLRAWQNGAQVHTAGLTASK